MATIAGWAGVFSVYLKFALERHPEFFDMHGLLLYYAPRAALALTLSAVVYAFPTRNYKTYCRMAERAFAVEAAFASGDDTIIATAISRTLEVERNLLLRPEDTTERLRSKNAVSQVDESHIQARRRHGG